MTIAGVLLAAGSGSRFAGPGHKLLAPLAGASVVERSLGAMLAAGLDECAVVTGASDLAAVLALVPAPADGRVTAIRNERWASGIASSVRCATAWAGAEGHDAIVVGLADQPFVTPAAWRTVAAADSPIAVAAYDGVRGNPVRLGREVWPLLPVSGDEGARVVMARFPEITAGVACEGSPADIDTVEDLRRWS